MWGLGGEKKSSGLTICPDPITNATACRLGSTSADSGSHERLSTGASYGNVPFIGSYIRSYITYANESLLCTP